ncbi:MAG TPA: 2-amino-4-hydroxy-6-hydroxymethyldihydropteridine diphosphokinase [Acinetobacter ursingii]|uniref:2-amino-4-hydroxy-6-hydroxymethyldihydropteridine pyrophosphokinase n=1 Tax=Acinetobacter ursingii TaxID=108980 RepID=A0A3D2SRK7_9GAMM|nr:2-amino-4-hydroxy-6-hydroxymethyldihydropteridine diphosphokinase [Acinetobacter ursingii]MCH2005668.1 2-amino-4-hydroxy-6-hydroxymethyldihydropteridine diphosphokinase [Acinetobacter ursingii]MCU4305528.1 2-amino-4-hydroxy-6-hydroxymethyldihydropteridine diphosphokinase [Acinetobacter ursingii]MCU4371733.1 2-amino-4-hydroxy-6-hydroxymethyldihydropteridine diphosphokinase [Acinetobacter ursingii]MCU4382016.1 2-amino-4-hydroxy-6-hydroxymethyldihydropteridine diphosphokinase [Acinetobacter urs
MSVVTYIGMGSNLGDSRQILQYAVQRLKDLGQVQVSRLYQSPPMGPQDQPYYYNAAAQLITSLEPLDLLDQLQRIEQEAGRVRLRRWGERTLDLDLLIYAEQDIQNQRLTVPHPGLLERDFVIVPLLDIDPDLIVKGQKLKDLELVKHPSLTVVADRNWVEK